MKRGRLVLALVLIAQLALVAIPASAQTTDTVPCPATLPDAGFTDVDPLSVHKRDIDCIAFWDITNQVGSFGPGAVVTREQMALFLTRTVSWVLSYLGDNVRGFVDISGLSPASQLAINQLADLGITSGVTATTYEPSGTVTREQMALFLSRTVHATAVDLPDGSSQGFTDIGGLSASSQTAINQVRQLGITTGTAATTFGPAAVVTREQMASFLARTLNVIWTFDLLREFPITCNPPLESDAPNTVCTGSGQWAAGRTFRIIHGYGIDFPGNSSDLDLISFSLTLDGSSVALRQKDRILPGLHNRGWEAVFQGGLTGSHTLVGTWTNGGQVDTTVTLTVSFAT